jgi:hypothetical protein
MPALPNTLALASIADGSLEVAVDHRNNYAAIQTAVNAIIAALSGGTNGQLLKALSASSVGWGNTTTVSAMAGGPPGSPADGDIWVATAVDANGVRWAFQYNAGSASSFKWEFIGGAAVKSVTDNDESTAAVPYVDLATVQSITLARAGDYDVHWGCGAYHTASGAGTVMNIGITKSGALQFDSGITLATLNGELDSTRRHFYTAAAADVLKMQFGTNGGAGAHFLKRYFYIVPVRIS